MRIVDACALESGIVLGPKELETAQNCLAFPQQHMRQKLLFTGSRTRKPPVPDTITKLNKVTLAKLVGACSASCLPMFVHHLCLDV